MVTFYRRLPKFDYLNPSDINEALTLLAKYRNNTQIISGGTDLVPKLKKRAITVPERIIDIKNIPGLDYISYEKGNGLKIGALATISDIENSTVIKEKCNILFQAAQSMASPQVRHRGTIAGNICNAVPSADSAPVLLVLNANLKLQSKKGERIINIAEFFKGPGETILKPDELLVEIQLPDLPNGTVGKYIKLSPRRAMDLAVVGVAVLAVFEYSTCSDIRIALGAVSPTPVRATAAERLLIGKKPDARLIEKVAESAAQSCHPISDHRASAEYRTDMVKVLTKRAITDLWKSV
ncbi:MAG: xanthine dehydrogenase family protein subunit M [Dehalococcoidales bacterium]|nr:xanthine dehydrogenase family protein subunit M [Dehalococcoidales bacterium]